MRFVPTPGPNDKAFIVPMIHPQNLGHAKVRNNNTSFELTTLCESTAEGQEFRPHFPCLMGFVSFPRF